MPQTQAYQLLWNTSKVKAMHQTDCSCVEMACLIVFVASITLSCIKCNSA